MNPECINCPAGDGKVVKNGHFFRKSDSRKISTFYCKTCKKYFSRATFSPNYRQKKRRINHCLLVLLSMGMTQRDAARFLHVNRKTIARRLEFLGTKARQENLQFIERFQLEHSAITELQFDDLITIEHTKCKPVSLTVAVDAKTRLIIDTVAAQIPASGHLAAISRKKYGKRPDLSRKARAQLFAKLACCVPDVTHIASDQHKDYPRVVKAYFPGSQHTCYKSIKGSISGQGELKKTGFDPLFSINHTLAMLRAKICRLFRRTWNTTKRIDRLLDAVAIYTLMHNRNILKNYVKRKRC